MGRLRAAVALAAILVAGAIVVSGGSPADPRTPPALPGHPAPFLGTAVAGSGGLTAAIDTYGDVVDLRPSGPSGPAAIENSAARQVAGTVPADTGIVPRVAVGDATPLPLWRAEWVRQDHVRGSNVVRTAAKVGETRVRILDAAGRRGGALIRAISVRAPAGKTVRLAVGVDLDPSTAACSSRPPPLSQADGEDDETALRWRAGSRLRVRLVCRFGRGPASSIAAIVAADRRWLARARPLGRQAPGWARGLYARSLLVLRALTDAGTGAVAAGARDRWAYVWPRDAAAAALALAGARYLSEARRIVGFLRRLEIDAGTRFHGDGEPVADGRPLQGDARGWVAAAATAAAIRPPPEEPMAAWRDRGDYGERAGDRGDYLANAIASGVPTRRLRQEFARGGVLVRRADDPASGVDSAAAWAVRPFTRPAIFPIVRASLARLLAVEGRYGIPPAEEWPGEEPWTAPTAWVAWSLAELGERHRALRLASDLRRAAGRKGTLPERLDAGTGIPRSTTPLAWSHAFTALALQSLWPRPAASAAG